MKFREVHYEGVYHSRANLSILVGAEPQNKNVDGKIKHYQILLLLLFIGLSFWKHKGKKSYEIRNSTLWIKPSRAHLKDHGLQRKRPH